MKPLVYALWVRYIGVSMVHKRHYTLRFRCYHRLTEFFFFIKKQCYVNVQAK
jgi:hypothetical protein